MAWKLNPSVSLAMVADNLLIEELRVMVSKFGQYGDQICGGSKIPRHTDELWNWGKQQYLISVRLWGEGHLSHDLSLFKICLMWKKS